MSFRPLVAACAFALLGACATGPSPQSSELASSLASEIAAAANEDRGRVLDDGLVVMGAASQGETVQLVFQAPPGEDTDSLRMLSIAAPDVLNRLFAASVCSEQAPRIFIDVGGTMNIQILDQRNQEIALLSVSDCRGV